MWDRIRYTKIPDPLNRVQPIRPVWKASHYLVVHLLSTVNILFLRDPKYDYKYDYDCKYDYKRDYDDYDYDYDDYDYDYV